MPSIQRLILLIASICFLVLVVRCIRKQHLSVNRALLWIVLSIAGIVAALVPAWVYFLTNLFGFELPVNLVFFACIFFLVVTVLSLSMVASSQTDMIRGLVQEVSLLRARVEVLEASEATGTQCMSGLNSAPSVEAPGMRGASDTRDACEAQGNEQST